MDNPVRLSPPLTSIPDPAGDTCTIMVLSDIHYAGAAEQARGCPEFEIIENPLLRGLVKFYRHFIWRRNPFAHNPLLERFMDEASAADYVVANGDYSCDSAFIGVCDDAAFESAKSCVDSLRARFDGRVRFTLGDHELGKMSLFGGRGGLRIASWERAARELGLDPFWKVHVGKYVLMGVTSSVLALPVFEPEIPADELAAWKTVRTQHLNAIRKSFTDLEPGQRVILFCHDPTALPFLWQDPEIQPRLAQVETTIIGHLHSRLFLWKGKLLSGMPVITVLGNSIRRMSAALHEARVWRHFRVRLCPALAGIELFKRGGYLRLDLDPTGRRPVRVQLRPLRQR